MNHLEGFHLVAANTIPWTDSYKPHEVLFVGGEIHVINLENLDVNKIKIDAKIGNSINPG